MGSAVEALKAVGLPWRLIVPEARPYPDVVADFGERWTVGAAGMPGPRPATWDGAAEWLRSTAFGLIRQMDASRVVPLAGGAPEDADGRQRAYMATRCDILLALPKDRAMKPGGTVETLSWRENPEDVPPEVAVRPRARRPLPPGLQATVVAKPPSA